MLGGHEKAASVGGLCGAGAGYVCLAAGFVSELAHQDGSMARAFNVLILSQLPWFQSLGAPPLQGFSAALVPAA